MRVSPFAIGSIYIRQQGLPEYATSLSTPIRTDVSVIDKWDQAIKVHLVNTSTGTKDFWPGRSPLFFIIKSKAPILVSYWLQ